MLRKIRSLLPFIFGLFLFFVVWNKLAPNETRNTEQDEPFVISVEDFKIVDIDVDKGRSWSLGDVRRTPLNQKYQHVSYKSLPKLSKLLTSPITKDSVGLTNRTNDQAQLVIYNRVPKTASSTMQNLISLQSDDFNFTYFKSDHYWRRSNSIQMESELVKFWKNFTQDTIYDQHNYFVETKRYDENLAVNWINIARDPIDRLVSDFYYNREEERWKDVQEKPSIQWFTKDLSQCILENDIECDFSSNDYLIEQQLTYFCGSAPECRQVGNYKALQVAKYNAEMHYAVIGITEHLRISLAVLEKYLPRYFNGIMRLYGRLQFLNQANDKVTTNKKPITSEARAILEKKLSLDIEFYDFLLQRLFNQANKCGFLS